MTELQRRFAVAERDGAAGIGPGDARDAVFRGVRRRRAVRSAGATVAVAVVVAGAAVATAAIVDNNSPIPPAVQATMVPQVTEAESVMRVVPGESPAFAGSARMWSEIDDRWALVLWGTSTDPGAFLSHELVAVAPDGRAWDLASVPSSLGAPQVLAWDPAQRTALITTSPAGYPDQGIGQLALVQLDGGEDTWTDECIDPGQGAPTEQVAAAVDGGYAVRNGCGEEFFTIDGGVRTELTADQQVALLDAEYPRAGVTQVVPSDGGVMVGNTDLVMDPAACVPLVLPRQYLVGRGCAVEGGFEVDAGTTVATITSLPGVEAQPNVSRLCGTGAVYGTLSDGSVGVGVIEGTYALPLYLDGGPVTNCVDGRYTWYIAGGDLFSSVSLDAATRLIDLEAGGSTDTDGLGALDVAPAPANDSLG